MNSNSSKQYQKMDELSEKNVPFFFIIDFLQNTILIFEDLELSENSLLFDFQKDKIQKSVLDKKIEFQFQSYPESLNSYAEGFRIVQENIKLGNSYLTNYTRETSIKTSLSLEDIFHYSQAKYKILLKDKFVSFSPETFVEIKDDKIFTQPMKGTIDATIPNAAELLKEDKKEKAEHYTVVDLLRNDLSIVANDVKVDHFQRIDFLKTKQKNLFAMSSEISGTLKPEFKNKVGSILKELLPAGSILGAPKQKTLETILKAEKYDRGFYTGIAGFYDGRNLDSCVLIRYIENRNGNLFFKSGGGITHLSKLEDEYQEMINKIYVPIY